MRTRRDRDGTPRVHRVFAVGGGPNINPHINEAQMQGGIGFRSSQAHVVVNSNFAATGWCIRTRPIGIVVIG